MPPTSLELAGQTHAWPFQVLGGTHEFVVGTHPYN